MKVSVIISSYNHEHFVADAIQSVIDQDFQDWELIIRDDGSTDATPRIIKSFKDPRIRFLGSGPNIGGSMSWNECIQVAQAPYIATFSSDDIFLPGKLTRQVSFLDETPEVAAVFSKARILAEEGNDLEGEHAYDDIFERSNRNRFEWLRHFFYEGNCLCEPSSLVRKSALDKIGLSDPRRAALNDFDYWIRFCLLYEIHILSEKLVGYRVRANAENESGDRPENHVKSQLERLQCLRHYRTLSPADYTRVFGGADLPGDAEPFDVDFSLARLCLEQSDKVLHFFGLELMNEIAGVPDRMARITEKSGYAYVDFHKDVANLDVFDVAGPAYRAESRMLFGAEEAEYSGETNLISHLSLRAKESFSVGFEFPDERKKIELLHWEVLRGYACRVKIIDAETNLGSIKLIPEKAFDHVAGFDRFFLSNPTYRVEGLTPLLLSDPHARLDWLKIRGQIHVFEPQEIGMQLHREFNNRIKQSVKQAVKQQKGVQQNLKQEIRQVNHLLHYHGSSPIRALSLWWNRKRLTDLRKSQLEKVVPDNSASGKPDHD